MIVASPTTTPHTLQLLFEPTPLGEALVAAYCAMQLENLWKPDLRGVIERNITAIARRQRTMQEVLTQGIAAFRYALQVGVQGETGVLHATLHTPGRTCRMLLPSRGSCHRRLGGFFLEELVRE